MVLPAPPTVSSVNRLREDPSASQGAAPSLIRTQNTVVCAPRMGRGGPHLKVKATSLFASYSRVPIENTASQDRAGKRDNVESL